MKRAPALEDIFLWPPPQRFTVSRGSVLLPPKKMSSWLRFGHDSSLPKQGYRLVVDEFGVQVDVAVNTGAGHALATLCQLMLHASRHWRRLPCLRIEDWPDFPVRGFMLDISRCKVPHETSLRELVQTLASLKYNHLQLYTEHTFAFARHKKVWADASPLTPRDLAQVQEWCAPQGIELSANFNSFGHFERWLKHPEYKHLAESPRGFLHPVRGPVNYGTTLKPNAASLKFLDELWKEYLPLFKSKRFNLGGDEPWELGQGWSKARVKKLGRHRVYLDFLKKLHAMAARHGKEMLFWGDILLESPEFVGEVPADATALLWGYEADHPFAEQCARLAAAQRKFWVCPGTSAWNTFTGRTDNMLANIESAAKHGRAHGAEGLLLTTWGDNGNHQPWPLMYPGLVYAAGLAWNQKGTQRADLARAVDLIFNFPRGEKFGEKLLALGRVENAVAKPKPNRGRHHKLFFGNGEQLTEELKTLSGPELKKMAAALAKVRGKLRGPAAEGRRRRRPGRTDGPSPPGARTGEELLLGADMAAWAVARAQLALAGKSTRPLAAKLRGLETRYEKVWPHRARPGGLRESLALMRAAGTEL